MGRFTNDDGTLLALGAAALVAATGIARARFGSPNQATRRLRPVYDILAREIPSAVLDGNEIYTVPDDDKIEPPPYGALSVMVRPHRDRKAGFAYQAEVYVAGRRRSLRTGEGAVNIPIPASATEDPREVARLISEGVKRWAPDLLDTPIDPQLPMHEGWAQVMAIREQARGAEPVTTR